MLRGVVAKWRKEEEVGMTIQVRVSGTCRVPDPMGTDMDMSFYPWVESVHDPNQSGYGHGFFLHPWVLKIKYVSVLSTAGLPIYPHSPQPSLARRHISGRFYKLILFWQLRVTAILVDHEISDVRKFISLVFQAYVDLSNWRLYVSCVSI
jgi:hypothetical protein